MTGMSKSKSLSTAAPCSNKNARRWAPPPPVVWPRWSRKAKPSFRPPSSTVNPPPGSPLNFFACSMATGASELAAALREALDHHTPRLSSVAFILSRRNRQRRQRTLLPVNLSRRPDLENLTVSNPSLEAYDELAQNPEEEDPKPEE